MLALPYAQSADDSDGSLGARRNEKRRKTNMEINKQEIMETYARHEGDTGSPLSLIHI